MAKTISFGREPTEQDIRWFVKHIGPRTHYLPHSIGGNGWRFTADQTSKWSIKNWQLTVDDEKMLMYYLLVR